MSDLIGRNGELVIGLFENALDKLTGRDVWLSLKHSCVGSSARNSRLSNDWERCVLVDIGHYPVLSVSKQLLMRAIRTDQGRALRAIAQRYNELVLKRVPKENP